MVTGLLEKKNFGIQKKKENEFTKNHINYGYFNDNINNNLT